MVQVIALTSFKEREQVQSAIQAGAIGYLLKDISAEDLARAIRQAHAGKPTLAPEAAMCSFRLPAVRKPDGGMT
jgi:two-component system, NarL family, response regulator LiaR